MTQKKLLKNILLLGGLSAVLAPIAIAASCGESSASTNQQAKTASTTFTSKIKANTDTSRHNAVTWATETDPTIAKVQYFYATTPQNLTALKSEATVWSNTLPDKVNLDVDARYLWVKLTPVSGYELANNIIDITTSSQINAIKTNLDAEADYANFDAGVKITVDPVNPYPIVQEVNVPSKATWAYDLPSKVGATLSELQALLAEKPTVETLNLVKAYLKPVDETKYLLTIKKVAVAVAVNTAQASTAFVNDIKALGTSTHDAVKWTPVDVPKSIAKVQYFLSSTSHTLQEVKNPSTTWVDVLPSAVDFEKANRYLWVKLTPATYFELSESVIDITTASEIGLIKSNLNVLSEVASFKLTIKINADGIGGYTLGSIPPAPYRTAIFYEVPNNQSATLSDLQALLYTKPEVAVLNTIKAYLKTVDETQYILTPTKVSVTVSLVPVLAQTEKDELYNKVKADVNETLSNHTAVKWGAQPTWQSRIASVSYLSGDYADETAAKNANVADWTTFLPTSIDYRPSKRHLWARVNGSGAINFENPYVDLTDSSNITRVPVLIDKIDTVGFGKIDLSKLVLNGSWGNLQESIPTSANFTLPTYLKIRYNLGSVYSSLPINEKYITLETGNIAKINEVYEKNQIVMTDVSAQYVKAYLEIDISKTGDIDPNFHETIKTVLSDSKIAKPTLPVTIDPASYLKYLKVSGTYSAVVWNFLPIGYGVESVKFLLAGSDYITKEWAIIAVNRNETISALPTTVSADKYERNIWVIVTPKSGFSLKNNENYFHINVSSGLDDLV